MSFWDEVYKLRGDSIIPREWKRAHLLHHLSGKYKPDSITTIPSNGSISRDGKEIGDYVKRGGTPMAWRVGDGVFQLVVDPHDDELTRLNQLTLAKDFAKSAPRAETRSGVSYDSGASPTTAEPLPDQPLTENSYPLRGMPYKYARPFDGTEADEE